MCSASESLSFEFCFSVGFYGKKIDPEPGRCRRTDGKKWRCSRDAHPDSKYCDRHMIRRRYRSRKPVESSQTHSSSSASAASSNSNPVAAAGGGGSVANVSATAAKNLHTLPLHINGAREGFTFTLGNNTNTTLPHLHMNPLTLSADNTKKTYRYVCFFTPFHSFRLRPFVTISQFLFAVFNHV